MSYTTNYRIDSCQYQFPQLFPGHFFSTCDFNLCWPLCEDNGEYLHMYISLKLMISFQGDVRFVYNHQQPIMKNCWARVSFRRRLRPYLPRWPRAGWGVSRQTCGYVILPLPPCLYWLHILYLGSYYYWHIKSFILKLSYIFLYMGLPLWLLCPMVNMNRI